MTKIELNIKAKRPPPPKPKAGEKRLIKALADVCQSHEQFARIIKELEHASQVTPVKWNAEDLNGALTWAESPQGHAYWCKLHYDLWN